MDGWQYLPKVVLLRCPNRLPLSRMYADAALIARVVMTLTSRGRGNVPETQFSGHQAIKAYADFQ